MRLHDHFLPSDVMKASREYHCTRDLIVLTRKNLMDGNIEKAKHLSIELTRSLHELSRLADKKIEVDKIKQLYEQMNVVQVIRRISSEGRN